MTQSYIYFCLAWFRKVTENWKVFRGEWLESWGKWEYWGALKWSREDPGQGALEVVAFLQQRNIVAHSLLLESLYHPVLSYFPSYANVRPNISSLSLYVFLFCYTYIRGHIRENSNECKPSAPRTPKDFFVNRASLLSFWGHWSSLSWRICNSHPEITALQRTAGASEDLLLPSLTVPRSIIRLKSQLDT